MAVRVVGEGGEVYVLVGLKYVYITCMSHECHMYVTCI